MLLGIIGVLGTWTVVSEAILHWADEENKKLALKPIKDYLNANKNPPELDKELANEGRLATYAADNDNKLLEVAIERGDTEKAKILVESYYVKERIFTENKYGKYDNYSKLQDLAIKKRRTEILVSF